MNSITPTQFDLLMHSTEQALPVNQLNFENLYTILNLIENGSEGTQTLRGISSVTSDHYINAILNSLANSGLIFPPKT